MKRCLNADCGVANCDEDKYCVNCGGSEFEAIAEEQEGSQGINIGKDAVATGEFISGGKNNTTHNTTHNTSSSETVNNSTSTTTNVGASGDDITNIIKTMMQENSKVIQQVLEHKQQVVQVVEPTVQEQQGELKCELETQQQTKAEQEVTKEEPEYSEVDLIAINYCKSFVKLREKLYALPLPQSSFYMRRYYYVMWIAASVFCFISAAATGIGILWIALLGSLAMVGLSLYNKSKSGGEQEPCREKLNVMLREYDGMKRVIELALDDDHEIVVESREEIERLQERFEAADAKAAKGAKSTAVMVSVALVGLAILITTIAVS